MIDNFKRLPSMPVVLDIGTGSGALAITAKLEQPGIQVIATDIDPLCLQIAQRNAETWKVAIAFVKGDLMEPIKLNRYSRLTVLANLPYVPNDHLLNQAALNEPRHAIFGGPDGLGLYRRLFRQLQSATFDQLFVLTESLPFQHQQLQLIAEDNGFRLIGKEDFIQTFELN
jgi:release factor glutamine methyltransferase